MSLRTNALWLGAAIVMLTACGQPQPPADVAHQSGSWTLPLAAGKDLLYVSGQSQGVTKIYSFPGVKLVGSLSNGGYTGGLCSDRNGNVFITTQSAIYEYPHGLASPVATLADPQASAYGCSVDGVTGSLAVISTTGVAIYRPAPHDEWHLPRLFVIKANVLYGGYDGSGNLFVDGRVTPSTPVFFELRKGGSRFQAVTLNHSVPVPGNVEWDGSYLAIGDNGNRLIHRFSFNGTHGTQVGTVTLTGPAEIHQFWIQGNVFIGPAYKYDAFVGLWRYPYGGVKTKFVFQLQAYGATVSVAPH